MRQVLAIALLLALAVVQSSAKAKTKEYPGADAGYLVYAAGSGSLGLRYSFLYHRISPLEGRARNDWKGRIEPKLGGAILLKVKNPDFTGEEFGHVIIRRLPPGHYEVHKYEFFGSLPGVATYHWTPKNPFSLPFEVRSGEATYIGSFARFPSLGTSLQPQLGAAGYFVVADRSHRDVPIAKGRLPANIKMNIEVTDVSKFQSPALRTDQP